MSSAIKIIVVLVVVAGGVWLVLWSGWIPKSQPTVATPQPVATTTTPTPPPQPPPDMNGMSAAGDSSDAAFAQDVAAIDTQLQGLGTDVTSYDATITDKPTPQAY